MASARDLKKKIRSTTNTKKITRTMELVATSKAKRAQNRVTATTPYSEKLAELLERLAGAGTVKHPLLETPSGAPARTALLVITANRGLCGGYNSGTLSLAEKFRASELDAGREVDLYTIGRKGLARWKFLKLDVFEGYTHFDDRPSFKDTSAISEALMRRFLDAEVDRVTIISTRYISAGSQLPKATQILPIQPPERESAAGESSGSPGGSVEFIFEPDPAAILEELLPLSVKTFVHRSIVEAVASEQIARRMAMKRATDAAEEMITAYTRQYNRSRQAGITQQINEIVSGAKALE